MQPSLPVDIQVMIISYSLRTAWEAGAFAIARTATGMAAVSRSWCAEVFACLAELQARLDYDGERAWSKEKWTESIQFRKSSNVVLYLLNAMRDGVFNEYAPRQRMHSIAQRYEELTQVECRPKVVPPTAAESFQKLAREHEEDLL